MAMTPAPTDPPALAARCARLQAENDLLRSELEEHQFRERNLRKELEIMGQLRESQEQQKCAAVEELLVEELRAQVSGLSAEKQQLEASNRCYQEKFEDLKHNYSELKTLNERTTQLHLKELEMARKEAAHNEGAGLLDRERKLAREKEGLEKKLEECARIAKDMEDYYMAEARKLKEAVRARDDDIRSLTRELEGARTHRASHGESAKQCNERWERACAEMREGYELENRELRNKVKFLINKLEGMQEASERHGEAMLHSKMGQSSTSIDSFRFTPNSSISSAKDPPREPTRDAPSTRRNTSGVKANQGLTQKLGKSYGPLAERSNF